MGSLSDLQVGFLSTISPLLGVAGALYVSYRSDRKGNRKAHMAACYIVAGTGLLASTVIDNPIAAFILLSIGNAAVLAASPLFWAIGGTFFTGAAAAACVAVANIIAQIGGVGPWLIGVVKDATGSFTLGADCHLDLLLCRRWSGAGNASRFATRTGSRSGAVSEISRRGLLNTAAAAATGLSLPTVSCAGQAAGDPRDLAQLLGSRRILLKNAIILTLDPAIGDLAQGDVLIENGKIAQIAPRHRCFAGIDRDCRSDEPDHHTRFHRYACPFLSGIAAQSSAQRTSDPEYNRDIQNNLTLHYRPEDVYAGVLITALSLIDNGTTTIVDISQIAHSPEHSDANIQALEGFRHSRGVRLFAGRRTGRALSRRSHPPAEYIFQFAGPVAHAGDGDSIDPKTFQFARANGVRSVLHIRVNSEPLLALGRAGLLRPGDEFIHCTHLTPEAWALIRDSGGRTSHCPPLEMAMGHGYPAIQDALDHGMRPSLSSDHSATVAQDMFGIMRAGFDLQRLALLQRAMRKEDNLPALLTPREVLTFATIEGARCAALEAKTGSLSPGKDADLVVLRADRLDVWPRNNAYGTVVNLMNPGHVEAVFIAGKVRKWQGSLVGVDIARVIATVEQSRNEVLRRGNFTPNLLG